MNDLSKRIAALSPEQQALLKQRLNQQKTIQQPQSWAIPERDKTAGQDRFAVSFGQQRMWFQDQLGTQSAISNNVSISLKISGNLDVNALERSLVEILDRHEVLRTTFQTIAGELIQIIHPVGNWYVPFIDLRSLAPLERELEIERIAQAQACQIFNLETDILLRSSLLICAPTEHILLLTLHHISVDAWSIGVFFRELSAIYAAFASGKPSPLAALPIQYADFAIWQKQHLQGQMLAADLAYWQQKLHQAPDLLPLPSDRSRPPVQSFTGKTLSFNIPKPLTDSISALSQQAGCTTFVTLLAALQTLLFRYSGQEDILVGAPIANRQQPELENLIGCFINTLVFRSDLSGNPSFRTLLDRVRETVLSALAHQTLPFEKLVEKLQLARNLTYAPLFQVMLVFQNAFSIENIELPNLVVEHDRIDNHTSQFDFTIHLVESEIGLIGKLEYNTDLFDESTIERLLAHFHTLLAGIVANPDCYLADLPILTAKELQQLQAWNQIAVNDLPVVGIDRAFALQVERTPDAVAVICGDERLTYGELDRRTNQLAHYLQNLGVKPESLVGICVDRSIETIVGLLSIIKAGGAYVPLDPHYPAERLEFILADAQVSVLFTKKSLVAKLPKFDAPAVLLDADWVRIALESEIDLAVSLPIVGGKPAPLENRLAYIIYTSGSTGQPKGVIVQHDSLANYTAAAIREYAISDRDRVLQFASLSFDAAAEEIFPCLTCGATLVLRTEAMLSSISIFLHTCDEWQITVLDLPTAFWHQMVTEMETQKLTLPDAVRLVILGGEKAARDCFTTWQKLVKPHVRLVNSYGPTEATIVTTTIDLSTLTVQELTGRELPIGIPVANASTYILDSSLQPTPIGIPGELYIGGAGVARGYLNRPDLTALAFISDPFKPNARLYKTGDRVRYWADGKIEFLGRIDRQVKIRGFRIELGEIEALLTQHPQVRESLVIDLPDANGDKQIIAYVVPTSGSERTIRSLRRLLETRLPKYMMPAGFMLLAALPLNANGKIDRQMLPAPELDRSDLARVFIAPRNSIEMEIARIFGEVLNLVGVASLQENRVGVDDDFFELGGHSLLATKLIAQLLANFEVPLSIVDLFQSPTVAGLAERIDRLSADNKSSLHPINRTYATSVPLSFSQESIWAWHHAGSSSSALNSSIVLRIKGDLNPAVVERSFNEIIRRHEILRTVFREVDDRPIQFILPTLHLPLGYRDLQPLPPAERELAAFNLAIDLATPEFDLAVAPLLRTNLLQLAPQEHWLLLTIHHIITDGSSFSLLINELHQLIQAFDRGLPSPLPAVTLQYADLVAWQQQPEQADAIAEQLAYWQQKLSVDNTTLSPSTAEPLSSQSKYHFSQFPTALVEAIESLSRALNVTTFTILATGLQLTLAAESGQFRQADAARTDIAIVTTVGNRTIPQTQQMLGCFINEVILTSKFTPDLTGKMSLQQLQLDIQQAIAHKDVPFESVLDAIELHGQIDIAASLTVTNSTQGVAPIPGWELLEMQTKQQHWDDISAELYAPETPLEFYIEMSKPMRVMVNYGIERYTEESIAQLLASYKSILMKLAIDPEISISELRSLYSNYPTPNSDAIIFKI